MESKKKNVKLIIGIIIGMLLTSGISVFATSAIYPYVSTQVKYKEDVNVKQALDDLYRNKKETSDTIKNINGNGTVCLDKYYKNLNVNVPKSTYVKIGQFTTTKGENSISVGFKPSFVYARAVINNIAIEVYDEEYDSSKTANCRSGGSRTIDLGSTSSYYSNIFNITNDGFIYNDINGGLEIRYIAIK